MMMSKYLDMDQCKKIFSPKCHCYVTREQKIGRNYQNNPKHHQEPYSYESYAKLKQLSCLKHVCNGIKFKQNSK